jgi:hypothetical protein
MTIDISLDDPQTIAISAGKAAQIAELLTCCDAFLREAGEPIRAELRRYLGQHPGWPDAGWLIDMLGFDALFLQAKLAAADQSAGTARQVIP